MNKQKRLWLFLHVALLASLMEVAAQDQFAEYVCYSNEALSFGHKSILKVLCKLDKGFFCLKVTLLVLLSFYVLDMKGQEGCVMPLVKHSDRFNEVLPHETVYLHFDNTGYYIGETMWFKAYVVQSDGDSLTRKSSVLYVELVDPLGMVVETHVLQLKQGQAYGDFLVLPHLSPGFYEVRAYTRYMLNYDARGVFSRTFPFFAKPKEEGDYSERTIAKLDKETLKATQRKDEKPKKERLNVDFYPEGGGLVRGKQCRVAFDVYNREGHHVNAECVLTHGGKVLATTHTDRWGRGSVTFVPDSLPYALEVRDGGKTHAVPLPYASASGCAMTVDVKLRQIGLRVSPTASLNGSKLGVIVSHHGQVEKCDSFVVDGGDYTRQVDVDSLADGVNCVTVFSVSGAILAERLFFVYPRRRISPIDIKIENQAMAPYDSVTIVAHTQLPNTTFSLAVRDADTQLQGTNADVVTSLLLASDLKGYIENADYFLESDDEAHRVATDLLMLVQGWRKYDFEMMDGLHKLRLSQPAEPKRLLMGQLHPYKKKDSVVGVDLSLVLVNHYNDLLYGTCTTNEKGYYTFEVPDCWGDWNMVMRTSIDDKNKNYYIGVNRNFSPEPRMLSPYEQIELPVDTPKIRLKEREIPAARYTDAIALKEVKVTAKRKSQTGWDSETYGAWKANLRYNCTIAADRYADEGQRCPSLYEWLKEQNPLFVGADIVSGALTYRKKEYNYHDDGPSYDNKSILWFLNNRFMFGTGMSSRFVKEPKESEQNNYGTDVFPSSLDECSSVYISTNQASINRFIARSGIDGTNYVAVYVYASNAQYGKQKGMRRTFFQGFNNPTTFQHPNYRLMPEEPDFRRTLYWNPNVTTDAQGNAKVGFYNNSTCRQLVISAEGVADNGSLLMFQ